MDDSLCYGNIFMDSIRNTTLTPNDFYFFIFHLSIFKTFHFLNDEMSNFHVHCLFKNECMEHCWKTDICIPSQTVFNSPIAIVDCSQQFGRFSFFIVKLKFFYKVSATGSIKRIKFEIQFKTFNDPIRDICLNCPLIFEK